MTLTIESAFDISDIGTVTVSVVETGGSSFSASVSSGQYFLSYSGASAVGDFADRVTSITSFLAALASALTAAGTGTYTCTLDTTTKRVSIAQSGGAVTAIAVTPVANGNVIGLSSVASGGLTVTAQASPYYRITPASGFYTDKKEREYKKDLAWDVVAFSGRVTGMSRSIAAKRLDLTVPLEPQAMVEAMYATTDDPWTWEHLFRHARNQQPLLIDDTKHVRFVYLTAEGAGWRPKAIASNYDAYYDVDILSWLQAYYRIAADLLTTEGGVTLATEAGVDIEV